MQYNLKSVVITSVIALIPALSFAHEIVGANASPVTVEISGALKLDTRTYFGDTEKTSQPGNTAGTYQSGTFIRDLGITFDGNVTEDFTYTIALNFNPKASSVGVDDAFITYNGFKDLMPNFSFSVGQVIPGFCVSCATSSKWIPFMERSMGTSVFGPMQGVGISANTYNNNYSVNVAAMQQPKTGIPVKDPNGNVIKKPDLWQGSGRFTYAPIAEERRVLQLGFSAHIQEYSNTGEQYDAVPEMRSSNSTTLINTALNSTPNATGTNQLISVKNQKTIDFEVSGINGPWSGEVEYQKAFITRGKIAGGTTRQGSNLSFYGYHGQVSYILTGESRPHKKSNGTFGQIKPHSKRGAWEISARYSVINLNNKDIFGGQANNTSASLSWYANNYIRVIGEYVFSKQKRQFPTYIDRRHVNGVGARVQVVF